MVKLIDNKEWEPVFEKTDEYDREFEKTHRLRIEGGYLYRNIVSYGADPPIIIMNTVFVTNKKTEM